MSLVKNSDDLLVAAAKQCQLDDGTLPKGYLEAHLKLALKTLRKDAFGGMLTFHVEGGFKKGHQQPQAGFAPREPRLIHVHGDAKTLVIAPFITIQSQLTAQERELTGVTEDTIRHDLPLYSVGIEGAANIIEPIRNSQTGMRNRRLVLCAIHVLLADFGGRNGTTALVGYLITV
ncbi:hypothetical protein B0H14DRAFT_3776041 [Mycena olivaceomarginata]|nr:hypothetical protein B0H14DRAFT_3776041 [Mycena olivaceomarginata]